MSLVDCQDSNPLSIENEPEVRVVLSVDTRSESSDTFACYECVNCHQKSNVTVVACQLDVNMCFVSFYIGNSIRNEWVSSLFRKNINVLIIEIELHSEVVQQQKDNVLCPPMAINRTRSTVSLVVSAINVIKPCKLDP